MRPAPSARTINHAPVIGGPIRANYARDVKQTGYIVHTAVKGSPVARGHTQVGSAAPGKWVG